MICIGDNTKLYRPARQHIVSVLVSDFSCMGSNPERVYRVALLKWCNRNLVVRRRLYVVHLVWIVTLCTGVQFFPSELHTVVAS